METETDNRFAYLEIDLDDAPVTAPAPTPLQVTQKTVDEVIAERKKREQSASLPQLSALGPGRHTMPVWTEPTATPQNVLGSALTAVEQADATTGAITYYRTRGGISLPALAEAWRAEGLDVDDLLTPPTKRVALQRALRAIEDEHVLVDDSPAGGWQIVSRTIAGGKTTYTVAARCHIKDGNLTIDRVDADDEAMELLTDVLTVEHEQQMRTVTGGDVGSWLTELLTGKDGLAATSLRETGGVYFVTPEWVGKLNRIKNACASVGVTIHAIPAVRSRETIEAVLDAVAREAADGLVKIREEMTDARGKKWVASRLADLDALEQKIAGYERFLGMQLDATRTDVINTRALLEAHSTRGALLEVETATEVK